MRSAFLTVTLVLVSILAGGNLASSSAISPRSHGRLPQRHRHANSFIHLSCRSTRYPAICEQTLSVYAPAVRHSPRQLARAALSVSAARAHDASSFVSRLSAHGSKSPRSRGGGALRDCIEVLSDSVDRLRRSAKEMNRMGRYGSPRFNWHVGNVQTWASAALTDMSTCLDSLADDGGAPALGARSGIGSSRCRSSQATPSLS